MDIDDASSFHFTGISSAPRLKKMVTFDAPELVRNLKVEGVVNVELVISATGSVLAVHIVRSLHPEADKACTLNLKKSKWKPGKKNGRPVSVRGVPFTCRYQLDED